MRLTSLKLESVEDLFLAELRDLYDAENQLLKALPKLAEAATAPALKMAFSQHLEETKGHVGRLDRVFRELDAKPSGETCEAMKGSLGARCGIDRRSSTGRALRDGRLWNGPYLGQTAWLPGDRHHTPSDSPRGR
jgi:ferritin-like metal-binding protein YciE